MAEAAPEQTQPILTYFKLHGKVECIRMLLAKANVQYTDQRLEFPEVKALKESGKLPAGQVPLYQDTNGRVLNQSFAILRMLGRQHGFYSETNPDECYEIDWALETVLDWWAGGAYRTWFTDEPKQEDLDTAATKWEVFNGQINAKLASRGDSAKFIAGDKLTIADFAVYSLYMAIASSEYNSKPAVAVIEPKVTEKPAIVAYLARMRAELPEYMEARKQYKYSI